MNKILIVFACLLFQGVLMGQNLRLKVKGANDQENKVIDSVGYKTSHINLKEINLECNLLSTKLIQIGYIEQEIVENEKINDSTFSITYHLGKKTNSIYLYIGNNEDLKSSVQPRPKNDTLAITMVELEKFMTRTLNNLERNGFSLSKLNLQNFRIVNRRLYADLKVATGNKRKLNDIVIDGYPKFPESHIKNIKRNYKNKTFNLENLKKVNDDFNKFRFVSQKKYPEILFTKDTTKIYVYLEKAKPNRFDGLIGFSNDVDGSVRFNGYLDLLLVNILNSGEALSLFWKSDGNDQINFNVNFELPYIFKSRFALKTSLNIFKQDSTFQNTKTNLDLGYLFDYNTRLYIGYQAAESSDIQNTNNANISDFKNAFTTLDFEYIDFKSNQFLFPEKTRLSLKAGIGNRKSSFENNQQLLFEINAKHDFYLNDKNIINLKSQNYYLKSGSYITNELYRFGGINSVRGFNENSLQANFLASILTEYRYVLAQNLYLHTITDYGFYRDATTSTNKTLLGIGFGFGLLTKNGLLNLVYANGSTRDQPIQASNSIVHLKFVTNF